MFDKLVDLIVSWIKLFFFCYVLHEYEGGIVLRFGKFYREVGPGLHFRLPFDIDEVFYTTVVPNMVLIGPQSLATKDDMQVSVSYLVTYKVESVKTLFLEVAGVAAVIKNSIFGVVSDFVQQHTWAELRATQQLGDGGELDLDNVVAKVARRRARRYGVHVMSVQFCDFTKAKPIRLVSGSSEHVTPVAHDF